MKFIFFSLTLVNLISSLDLTPNQSAKPEIHPKIVGSIHANTNQNDPQVFQGHSKEIQTIPTQLTSSNTNVVKIHTEKQTNDNELDLVGSVHKVEEVVEEVVESAGFWWNLIWTGCGLTTRVSRVSSSDI